MCEILFCGVVRSKMATNAMQLGSVLYLISFRDDIVEVTLPFSVVIIKR